MTATCSGTCMNARLYLYIHIFMSMCAYMHIWAFLNRYNCKSPSLNNLICFKSVEDFQFVFSKHPRLYFDILTCMYVCMYACIHACMCICMYATTRLSNFWIRGCFVFLPDPRTFSVRVALLRPLPCFMLENITTGPHAHEISADIVRVWLSGCILQQYVYVYVYLHINAFICMYTCISIHTYIHMQVQEGNNSEQLCRRVIGIFICICTHAYPYIHTYTCRCKKATIQNCCTEES